MPIFSTLNITRTLRVYNDLHCFSKPLSIRTLIGGFPMKYGLLREMHIGECMINGYKRPEN